MRHIPLRTRIFAPVNETPAHAAIIFKERSHIEWNRQRGQSE